MEDNITKIQYFMENWEMFLGYGLAILAGIDKVALVFIKTIDNIRDAWVTAFGKKDRFDV